MIDWKFVQQMIANADRILLTTHENPDGDGIGCASAMQYYLQDNYPMNMVFSSMLKITVSTAKQSMLSGLPEQIWPLCLILVILAVCVELVNS